MSRLALHRFRAHVDGRWRDDLVLQLDGERIAALDNRPSADGGFDLIDCGGLTLAPGFIDTQVNGGGGLLFNGAPSVDTLDRMRRAHWRGGTTAMLPTLITDAPTAMTAAVDATLQALDTLPEVVGLHLEGPHLAPERKGVHAAEHIRPFDAHTDAQLRRLPAGRVLLTLAPERLPPGTIADLIGRGVRVSAGHSEASYAQARAALNEGLSGFTHLHNAMSPLTSREPGLVGAALEDRDSYVGLIVDGHHVHPATAALSVRAKARGRTLLVTDAMAVCAGEADHFELYGQRIAVQGGRCSTADGTLAGSALDMATAVRNCVTTLGIPLEEALRMAGEYPAAFLGLSHERGQLRPGLRADLVLLDAELQLQQTWVGGVCRYSRGA